MEPLTQSKTGAQAEFLPGSSVIYAMHGKCSVLGTETRSIEGELIRFYKLEIKKSTLSRSSRLDPAIWVPVATAFERGMRSPMNKEEAEGALQLLLSREYFFSLNETWNAIQPKLESTIRNEGGIGLAKAASYLHVLLKRQIVPKTEIVRFQETVNKLLFRELSDTLGESIRNLEEKVAKGLRSKLLPDS